MTLSFTNGVFLPAAVPSQNLVDRLMAREINGQQTRKPYRAGPPRPQPPDWPWYTSPPQTLSEHHRQSLDTGRAFYVSVTPNYTVVNVEKPPCFLRKFTPDGRRFVAFSHNQTELEIYLYRGPAAAAHLTVECEGEFAEEDQQQTARRDIFKSVFELEHVLPLCAVGVEQLNRECSLFSEDGDYVIVGSATYLFDDQHPLPHELLQNNESVAQNPKNPLENYTFYCVELSEGILTDRLEFRVDKIFLSHNQGVYLYRNVFAILSVEHQTVHIYKLHNGNFVPEMKVGRTLYEDDDMVLAAALDAEQQTQFPFRQANLVYREYREKTINALKHRVLVFLWRRAVAISRAENGDLKEIMRFYQYFDQFKALRIWKMQLLDESHLLLKYAHEDVVTLRCAEPNAQTAFFVVFDFRAARVLAVYDNTSSSLLSHFENFSDFFRNTNVNLDDDEFRYSQSASSPSNNVHARLSHMRFKQTIVSAKNGGAVEARKRVLAQLPISAQSFST